MPEYLMHKYSKRVWEVKTDHGPESPYLYSFPYVRECGMVKMKKFFTPCQGPSCGSKISIHQEMEWENRQMIRELPIEVKAPKKTHTRNPRKPKPLEDVGYTLRDLCSELGISPSRARKLLRSGKKAPPNGVWRWGSREEAKSIKRFLKKFL